MSAREPDLDDPRHDAWQDGCEAQDDEEREEWEENGCGCWPGDPDCPHGDRPCIVRDHLDEYLGTFDVAGMEMVEPERYGDTDDANIEPDGRVEAQAGRVQRTE